VLTKHNDLLYDPHHMAIIEIDMRDVAYQANEEHLGLAGMPVSDRDHFSPEWVEGVDHPDEIIAKPAVIVPET